MSDTAFQKMYRQEFISGFELRQSLIRKTVTHEAQMKGNEAVFLVADSDGAEAVTRGVNGLIPANVDNLDQYTVTLKEWHDLRHRTSFNIFASQGDGRRIMQENSMGVINRKVDQDIIAELENATQTTGGAVKADLELCTYALTILGNNEVPMDGNITGLITPAYHAYLMQTKEFASADYINNKPFENMLTMFRWANVNWIVHPNLPGKGTSAEKCFMYHKAAVGHAANTETMDTKVGYHEEQDYSWARSSIFMGTKLLQSSGIVIINHDGSQFAAQA